MRQISTFAVAALVLVGVSSTVAVAGGRGGTGHGAASSMHSAPLAAQKPGGSNAAAGAVGPVGAPISSTLAPLPGNDRVTNCVHASGMAGLSGTAQGGPFVHSCAFGQ